MNSLDIKINIPKLLDCSESLKRTIPTKTLITMIQSFSYYVRELYIVMLKESMNSRRYKGKWEPTNEEGYREYLGVTPEKDILDLIEEALQVKKIGSNFYVKFDPRYKYPGSKLTLIEVLRAIDSGTSKFNSRPIFNKTLRYLQSNILTLWKGYMLMKGVT